LHFSIEVVKHYLSAIINYFKKRTLKKEMNDRKNT